MPQPELSSSFAPDPLMDAPDVVTRAVSDLAASHIVEPDTSQTLTDVTYETNDGYREYAHGNGQIRRSEIAISPSAKVVVHKNTGNARGTYAQAGRFNNLEVCITGPEEAITHTLRIQVDPQTSGFNPVYLFMDGDERIGVGWGQRIDRKLAGMLGIQGDEDDDFRVNGDHFEPAVVEWIRAKLQSE